jgi:hypothetical protein
MDDLTDALWAAHAAWIERPVRYQPYAPRDWPSAHIECEPIDRLHASLLMSLRVLYGVDLNHYLTDEARRELRPVSDPEGYRDRRERVTFRARMARLSRRGFDS